MFIQAMYGKKITTTTQSNNKNMPVAKALANSNNNETNNTSTGNTEITSKNSKVYKNEICIKVDAVYNTVEGDTQVFKGKYVQIMPFNFIRENIQLTCLRFYLKQ